MKRLCFHLQHPLDPARVDVVELSDGAVLVDNQATGRYAHLISVSQLVRVEHVDDAALRVVADEGATVAPTPSPLSENVMEPHISPGLGVPTRVAPDPPSHSNAQESP